jgi:hypothetical protein
VPSEGEGIQKQCAAVFERSLWSHVATTKPRGLSSQGAALLTARENWGNFYFLIVICTTVNLSVVYLFQEL